MRARFPWARASCFSCLQQVLERCDGAAARLSASTRRVEGIGGAKSLTGLAAIYLVLALPGWRTEAQQLPPQGTHQQRQGRTQQQAEKALLQGRITARLRDSKAQLGTITITLSGGEPQFGLVQAKTDEDGRYEFSGLPPGSYVISIDASGFKPIRQPIVLRAGQRAVQNFVLELKPISEKVVVKESAQPTKSVSAPAASIRQSQLVTLPTREERVQEVIPLTPGVIATPEGRLVFKGADETQSLLQINSVRATDPVTGSFWIPIPSAAVEQFEVFTTPYDASLGSFSGGLTSVESRPPADKRQVALTRLGLTIMGKNGHMVGIASASPSVVFDTPIVRHKLLFSEVFQYEMKKTTVEGLPWPKDIRKRQGFNSFTTLEAILAPNHLISVTANVFPNRYQHIDISALVPQPASNDLNQSGVSASLSDKYQFRSGALFSATAAYTRLDSDAHGQGNQDMLITPEGWGGNYFNRWSRRGKEAQFFPRYEFTRRLWGAHAIRVGAEYDWRSYAGVTASHPIRILNENGSLAEETLFSPAQRETVSDRLFAVFAQDQWAIRYRWSLEAGARVSTETFGWPAAIAPRIGVAYSAGREKRTTIRIGGGVFYGVVPLLAPSFADNPQRSITQFDAQGLPVAPAMIYKNVFAGPFDPLRTPVLPSRPSTSPRNITWNAGIDEELRKNAQLHIGYLDSHTTYLFVVNPFTSSFGSDSFLGLGNNGSSHYRQAQVSLRFQLRRSDQVNASYIWSRSRGDLNTLSELYVPFAPPVIRPDLYGILPSDVPNRVVAWGIFSLPWNLTFSPLADIHSGYPYSPIDAEQEYAGIPNSLRFPAYFSLDLKLYRAFRLPFLKKHHLRLGIYSLNVTNHGNFTSVFNNVASPAFGQFTGFVYRRDGMVIDLVD